MTWRRHASIVSTDKILVIFSLGLGAHVRLKHDKWKNGISKSSWEEFGSSNRGISERQSSGIQRSEPQQDKVETKLKQGFCQVCLSNINILTVLQSQILLEAFTSCKLHSVLSRFKVNAHFFKIIMFFIWVTAVGQMVWYYSNGNKSFSSHLHATRSSKNTTTTNIEAQNPCSYFFTTSKVSLCTLTGCSHTQAQSSRLSCLSWLCWILSIIQLSIQLE